MLLHFPLRLKEITNVRNLPHGHAYENQSLDDGPESNFGAYTVQGRLVHVFALVHVRLYDCKH